MIKLKLRHILIAIAGFMALTMASYIFRYSTQNQLLTTTNNELTTKNDQLTTENKQALAKNNTLTAMLDVFKQGQETCNIACYSQENGNIASQNRIINIPGTYYNRICYPKGYKPPEDISKDKKFSELCGLTFSSCENGKCWIGGQTRN